MRIADKIKNEFIANRKPFYSFEYFPPKTEAGLHNLYDRIDRMMQLEPAFIDVTWGAGGTTADKTLEMSQNIQKYFGIDVLMHLTCTDLTKAQIKKVLTDAKEAGVVNILALRGDGFNESNKTQEFRYAKDLIKFIRDEFNNDFSICVGAYPEAHQEAKDRKQCIRHLKDKVDAGADFAITQLFYCLEEYQTFLKLCREEGITCPMVPGIMPIHNFQRFQKFVEFCKIKVPDHVQKALLPIKNDDSAVHNYGVKLAKDMSAELLEIGAPGLHFYTLNLETAVTQVLEQLGFTKSTRERKSLPWRQATADQRRSEDVRPIFWSNRPKSYLARTMSWDDFPNGRWGSSFSPTFGDLTDYYMFRRVGDESVLESRRKMWGFPKTVEDIGRVFVEFCSGKINRLPWCEVPVQAETSRIAGNLDKLNQNGYWTINSQPQVNGMSSTDSEVGWGGPGGFVYQKAYVEFFTTKEKLENLRNAISDFPSLTYQAVNASGESYSNMKGRSINAVTWGVFPGKEISQPTIVDSDSFMIWKDEAFQLWFEEWRHLYKPDSESYKLLTEMHDQLFLVNIVENDYVNGNIFKIFNI